jgi:hypothetical protein
MGHFRPTLGLAIMSRVLGRIEALGLEDALGVRRSEECDHRPARGGMAGVAALGLRQPEDLIAKAPRESHRDTGLSLYLAPAK